MKYLISFLLAFSFSFLQAKPDPPNYLNDAAYVAQVKSFSINGYLNCEFECYLDLNYSNFKEEPIVYFQLGTSYNPTEYQNLELNKDNIETNLVEQLFQKNNYKVKLNFGKISVKKDFIARIVIVNGEDVQFIDLPPTNFDNSLTIMDEEKDAEERGLCKADQFLRKIDFDRLYKEYSYVEE